ncbi:MAG: F-type H+-transporting ATPase subunit b [Pseudonocardiales bacterium]|nr:F-type H+-transporting ATPase subunit b [Pseudonocardiales bacterium]
MYDRTMTKYLAADNFLLPNGTFFAELVAFLLMLFVFWKFVVPPLSESLRERQEMVRKLVENSEEANRRLTAAQRRYEQALAEARIEAARIREAARLDGQRIREELRAQALEEVARIQERGEMQLAAQRERVVRELRHEMGDLALQLAEKLIGYELAVDEHKRVLVERFLADLDQLPASPRAVDRPTTPA